MPFSRCKDGSIRSLIICCGFQGLPIQTPSPSWVAKVHFPRKETDQTLLVRAQ